MFNLKDHRCVPAALAAGIGTLGAGSALAQSSRAYVRANCTASFLTCEGGGSAAPIGDLGGSGLEMAALAAVLGLVAFRVMARCAKMGRSPQL